MKIQYVNINEFNGLFSAKVELQKGLNIIAGENGTGKTRFLLKIKQNQQLELYGGASTQNIQQKIFALSPKRNSQRRNLQQLIQQMRRDNRGYRQYLNEAVQKEFAHGGFDNYPSFLELFLLYFDRLDKRGGERKKSMDVVAKEFNEVIGSVFDEYEVTAKWDDAEGRPNPIIKKRRIEIPATELSCGEDEVFSLILNLYSTRDEFDIFLIDEPEVHLNWHLEERMFKFLDKFTSDYDKQLIVATHSRIVGRDKFCGCAQFFYWDENSINVSQEMPTSVKAKLVDEGLQQLRLGNYERLTFFVEDDSHKDYISSLANTLRCEVTISPCGNSSNVKSIYKLSQKEGGWANCYFLIDSDNQGDPYPQDKNFLVSERYCIENYGLDTKILEEVFDKKEAEIRQLIFKVIKQRRNTILKNSKYLDFLFDRLKIDDITAENLSKFDGSEILPSILFYLGTERGDFWLRIFKYCKEKNKLDSVADKKILTIFLQVLGQSPENSQPKVESKKILDETKGK